MSNLGYSFTPVHPGEILKDELRSRGISQKRFSRITGIAYTMLNDILNAKRPLTTDVALTIEAVTGINADMLVNIQTRYNIQTARKDPEKINRLKQLQKACASLFLG
jgi:addiction module HigA family antidote